MGQAEDQRSAHLEHPVHLTEDPVEVLDISEGVGREDQVDGVGSQEGQVGQITLAQLDADFLFARTAGGRSASWAGEKSTPMAVAPCLANAIEHWAPPQPSSRTFLPLRSPSRRSSASVGMSGP